ncbi:MAG: HlyD family efflux transporter periplasmic adaptor subunit, partial [Planctomycetota bacterium]
FSRAASPEEFAGIWLALQCRNIPGALSAVLVLGEPGSGPFAPAAHWPEAGAVGAELTKATEEAISRRQPVLTDGALGRQVALPILVDGLLCGVCALSIETGGANPNDAVRQLRWGSGWIEVLYRRDQGREAERLQERTGFALEMLANVLEHKRFKAAATALVTELAIRLDCDQVSFGTRRRKRSRVAAVSHAADFGNRASLIRDIGAAMDEAIDQEAVVVYPAHDAWDYRVALAHKDLSHVHKVDSVLTVPVQHDGKIIGALTFERSGTPFDEGTIEACDAVATIVGPVLEERRRNDRSLIAKTFEVVGRHLVMLLGPAYFGRKLATLGLLLAIAFFANAKGPFELASPAVLEGSIQRTVVAPFNGYLASQSVRAGEIVQEGQLLAKLDDQDLVLERLRLTTARAQRQSEYDRALAERDPGQSQIIASQISQADSQIALIDEQLTRTRITAPFSGVVVWGDLSQSVGTTLERGETLFQIAPLDAFRVILEVDEGDIA